MQLQLQLLQLQLHNCRKVIAVASSSYFYYFYYFQLLFGHSSLLQLSKLSKIFVTRTFHIFGSVLFVKLSINCLLNYQ